MEQLRVHIRWGIKADLPAVVDIEASSFDAPWTAKDFLQCLRHKHCIQFVAEQYGQRVVGFLIYELHKDHLHILNFAVHPDHRRCGVGTQLITKLVSKLSKHRRTYATVLVRETNLTAQLFFREMGFLCESVVKNYYGDEDAYEMVYRVED